MEKLMFVPEGSTVKFGDSVDALGLNGVSKQLVDMGFEVHSPNSASDEPTKVQVVITPPSPAQLSLNFPNPVSVRVQLLGKLEQAMRWWNFQA